MVTNFFACQPLPSGNANGIVTALKPSMAAAGVDLETWLPKMFFYCGDGASVVQGEHGGVVAILGELQQQLTRHNVIVPYHASCHRCDPTFKAAMQLDHTFLDLLGDTLPSAASFWNSAPSRLKTLQAVAQSLEVLALKLGVLHTRRWSAFAGDGTKQCVFQGNLDQNNLKQIGSANELAKSIR